MTVIVERSPFLRAVLTLHMEDGTILLCDGRPERTSGVVVRPQRESLDIISVKRTSEWLLKPSDTEFEANIRWLNPKTSVSQEKRGWRGRFKKWIKEFPVS